MTEECSVEGCTRPRRARGWCTSHYQRWHAHGAVQADRPLKSRVKGHTCSITTCSHAAYSRDWCSMHYQRWLHHGDPLGGNPSPKKVLRCTVADDGTKTCTACEQQLPLSEFHRATNSPTGYRSQCKPCRTAHVKTWYKSNRQQILARQRDYYARDIDSRRERDNKRYRDNPGPRIALATDAVHRRRARINGGPSDRGISHAALRDRDGVHCCHCGAEMSFDTLKQGEYLPRKASIEHIIPIARGGTHTWGNVALACHECNIRRGARV